MNKVQLVGRLTKDVELSEFGKGKDKGTVCRGAIAVRDGIDKDGNQLVQFINFVAWNNTANILEGYTKKGDMIALAGRLTQNDYTDEEGVKHYTMQVTVSEVELLPQGNREEEEEKSQKKSKKYRR